MFACWLFHPCCGKKQRTSFSSSPFLVAWLCFRGGPNGEKGSLGWSGPSAISSRSEQCRRSRKPSDARRGHRDLLSRR
uniref:Uncharacterized protein n=1 Tax=Arundo donax TaxID=35708 RepID=A0A0A9GZP3_ARUDO